MDNHTGIVAAESCLYFILPSPYIPAEGRGVDWLPQSCSARMQPNSSTAPSDILSPGGPCLFIVLGTGTSL